MNGKNCTGPSPKSAAILGKPFWFVSIGPNSFWNVSVMVHLCGVLVIPALVLIFCASARRLVWSLILPSVVYLFVTLIAYPAVGTWVTQHYPYPGDPHFRWMKSQGPYDYVYIEADYPPGDAQMAGYITLFPPDFQIPKPSISK